MIKYKINHKFLGDNQCIKYITVIKPIKYPRQGPYYNPQKGKYNITKKGKCVLPKKESA